VVTSGTGQYAIVDLRPGTYTVTFTLPGFNTVKREGIELTGNFVASVNVDMRVGALEETITVSGEAPTVDVTSSKRQQTISGDVIAAIPSSRQYFGLTTLVPALNIQGNDIGGASGPIFSVFQIHGGRRNEGQVLVDGLSMGFQGMGVSFYVPEVGTAQEVTFSLSGGLGEAPTGGPQMNIVPRAGGNTFSGSLFVTGANGAMQGDNITQEIRDAGLTGRNELKKLWEVNPALGGPIRRDRLWFYGTFRHQGNRQLVAGMFENRNAGDPTKWTYDPDPSRQAVDDGTWKNGSLRLTWQATPRNKFNFWWDEQSVCQHCVGGGSRTGLVFAGGIQSPEAHGRTEGFPQRMARLESVAARGESRTWAGHPVRRSAEEPLRQDLDSGHGPGRRDSEPGVSSGVLVASARTHSRHAGIRVVCDRLTQREVRRAIPLQRFVGRELLQRQPTGLHFLEWVAHAVNDVRQP
jgi:hypothetical protein